MRLSDNERTFLAAMRDNEFHTIAQVTQYCGFTRQMGYHYYRSLSLGGLIDGFEPTYAGYKMLDDRPLDEADVEDHVKIRHEPVSKRGHHLGDVGTDSVL